MSPDASVDDLIDLAGKLNLRGHQLADAGKLADALSCYEESLKLREVLAAHDPHRFEPAVASVLVNLGIVHSDLGNADAAILCITRAIDLFRRHEHHTPHYRISRATALTNLGAVYRERREWHAAAECYKEAEPVFRNVEQEEPGRVNEQLAALLNNLGNLRMRQGQYKEAIARYNEAFSIYHSLSNNRAGAFTDDVAMVEANLGAVLWATNRWSDAHGHLISAIDKLAHQGGDRPGRLHAEWIRAVNNLGAVQRALGEFEEARSSFETVVAARKQEAANCSDSIPESTASRLSTALMNAGQVSHDLRDLSTARSCFEQAVQVRRQLAELRPDSYEPLLAAGLNSLGMVCNSHEPEGYDLARDCLQESVELYRRFAGEQPDVYRPLLARTLSDLGAVEFDAGQPTAARPHFEESLDIYQKLADRQPELYQPELARAMLNFGAVVEAAEAIGIYEAAVAILESDELASTASLAEQRLVCWSNLGRLRRRRALRHLETIGSTESSGDSSPDQAGELDSARHALRAARDHAESFRGSFQSSEQKRRVQLEAVEVYEQLVLTCLDGWKLDGSTAWLREAMEVADAARARNLNELIGRVKCPPSVPGDLWQQFLAADRSLRDARQVLQHLEAERRTRLFEVQASPGLAEEDDVRWTEESPESEAELARAVSAALDSRRTVTEAVKRFAPLFDPDQPVPPLPFDRMQSLVNDEPDTAIIQFVLTVEAGWAIVLCRDLHFAIELTHWHDEKAHRFTAEWISRLPNRVSVSSQRHVRPASTSSGRSWQELLGELSETLMRPVLQTMLNRGITWPSPDDSSVETRPDSIDRPLIRRLLLLPHRVLHLLPLQACHLPDGNWLGDVLDVVVAPSFSVLDQCRLRAAGRSVPKSSDSTDDGESLLLIDNPTRDLPFASLECAALAALFPKTNHLPGGQATRHTLLRRHGCRTFHYAGHASFDLDRPERSALILQDADDPTRWVTLTDILDSLELTSCELAIINGCESGLVQPSQVDEYTGLPAGLLHAGAQCVVNTLWPISDLSSALLMWRFHKLHREGAAPASALRAAQSWLREHVTAGELRNAIVPELLKSVADEELVRQCRLKARYFEGRPDDEQVFSAPEHWAAFTVTGWGF